MSKQIQEAVGRLNPAVVQIAIPSPAAAGAPPFTDPRVWHSAHANNLRRLMARAGFDEVKYVEPENDGRGAVLYFASYSVDAVPGLVPEPIQKYLEDHLSSRFLQRLRQFAIGVRHALDKLDDLFPVIGVVTGPIIKAIDVGVDVGDEVLGEPERVAPGVFVPTVEVRSTGD